jgi:uridine kinase
VRALPLLAATPVDLHCGLEMRIVSQQRVRDAGPMIVGIVGGSGSGKSWLANRLALTLGPERAGVICQDSFYKDLSHLTPAQRSRVNFDDPKALDWAAFRKCLTHVASGRVGRIPKYNFATHSRDIGETLLEPRDVVIFEGLWLLHRPALRRFFGLAVFIEAGSDLCLERRLQRDVCERGRCSDEVKAWYDERVLPNQRQFVDPQCWHADFILKAPVTEQQVQDLGKRISNLCGEL